MNARRVARRLAKGAGIAFIAGTVGGAALLAAEALAARLASLRQARPRPGRARHPRLRVTSPPLRLVLLGDATALGVGVDVGRGDRRRPTRPDARRRRREGRPVHCRRLGCPMLRPGHAGRPGPARASAPDLAVILIGTNDATHLVRPGEAAAALATAVRRLRDAGTAVVVGTCPDLGAVRAIAPPLRQIVGWYGRRVARAQASAARAAGAAVVDLASQVGPVFRADAGMLCHDGFHPSADGYRVLAYRALPGAAPAAVGEPVVASPIKD